MNNLFAETLMKPRADSGLSQLAPLRYSFAAEGALG